MEYEEYRAICAKCSAHGGPAELCKGCTVRAEMEADAYRLIMSLTNEEKQELLTWWKNRKASRTTADQSRVQKAV